VKAALGVYRALLRVGAASAIQYRASGVIWMIGSILEPVIYLVVWSVVARSSGGQVGGQGPHEIAAYYIALMLVNHLTFSWIMEIYQYRIQYGELSFQLLRPLHPIHSDLAENVAYKFVMLVFMLPAVLLLIIAFRPHFDFVPWSLLCTLLALPLALGLRFCLDWTLALAAFWTTRTTAINRIYFSLMVFLGGRVAPLSLLPGGLHRLSDVLPFYYGLGFPTELLLGRLDTAHAFRGLCMQLAWLAGALLMLSCVWRFALRRFSAVGA
jgi:ABC-2 type transport system permease protein